MRPQRRLGVLVLVVLLWTACGGEAAPSVPAALHPAGPACDALVDEYLALTQSVIDRYESVELVDLAREIPSETAEADLESAFEDITDRARNDGCGSGVFHAVVVSRGEELQAGSPAAMAVKANGLASMVFLALDPSDDGADAEEYLNAQLDPVAVIVDPPYQNATPPASCDEVANRVIDLASWLIPNHATAVAQQMQAIDDGNPALTADPYELQGHYEDAIEDLRTAATALHCEDQLVPSVLLTRGNELPTARGGLEIIFKYSLIAAAFNELAIRLAEPYVNVQVGRDYDMEINADSIDLRITATNVAGVALSDVQVEIDGMTVLEIAALPAEQSVETTATIPLPDTIDYWDLMITVRVRLPNGDVDTVTNPAWR
jgi:hypothetical protein